MPISAGLGTILGGIGGSAMGLLGGIGRKRREKRQVKYQKELMGMQQQNQKELNQQGHELQMKMWNDTNYGAQMEHIKGAGLNPALMYGMSGGGGTTTGSQGGGSASGGNGPQVNETQIMGMNPEKKKKN